MREIPSKWLSKAQNVCKQCAEVFDSDRGLHEFFCRQELYTWEEDLPFAFTKGERIGATLRYLQDKENARGGRALLIFFQALCQKYRFHNPSLHAKLQALMENLQNLLPPFPKRRVNEISLEAPEQSVRLATHELDQLRHCARSVALIRVRRFRQGRVVAEERGTGTGWLIAPGLVLTCWHVVAMVENQHDAPPEAADLELQRKDMLVYFEMKEHTWDGIGYCVEKLEFQGGPEQDFAVLRLKQRKGNPYNYFHYLPIESNPPLNTQAQLAIVQHPFGEVQQITLGGSYIADTEPLGRICYTTETHPGTSGAPVIMRHEGCAIALHNGKIHDEFTYNEGTCLSTIMETLETQIPNLFREIEEAQEKLRRPSSVEAGFELPDSLMRSSVAGATSVPAARDGGKTQNQSTLVVEKQLPRYSHKVDRTHTSSLLCLAFDATSQKLLYGAQDDGIHIAEATTLEPMQTYKTVTKAVPCLSFSRDGKYFSSGGDDGTLTLWQVESGQLSRYKTYQPHNEWVSCLAFSASGHYLLSGSDDGSIRILEISTRSTQQMPRSVGIRAITCHPQRDLIASCSLDQAPVVWPITSTDPFDSPDLTELDARCLLFDPSGRYLASGYTNGALVVYETKTWEATPLPSRSNKAIRCLAFHPEGSLLALGGDDPCIEIWDIPTQKRVQTLPGHKDRVTSLAFSLDGHLLASAGRDGAIFVWHDK